MLFAFASPDPNECSFFLFVSTRFHVIFILLSVSCILSRYIFSRLPFVVFRIERSSFTVVVGSFRTRALCCSQLIAICSFKTADFKTDRFAGHGRLQLAFSFCCPSPAIPANMFSRFVCNDFLSMPCQILHLSLLLPRLQRLYFNALSDPSPVSAPSSFATALFQRLLLRALYCLLPLARVHPLLLLFMILTLSDMKNSTTVSSA
jgi:hypothetical protein